MLRDPREDLHGKVLRYYEGAGHIVVPGEIWIPSMFCCFHYVGGRIDIHCYLTGEHIGPHPRQGDGLMDAGSIVGFLGEVKSGHSGGEHPELEAVVSEAPVYLQAPQARVTSKSFSLNSDRETVTMMELCISLSAVEISVSPENFSFAYFRFSLVNFLFEPTEKAPIPLGDAEDDGQVEAGLQTPIRLGAKSVFLRPVPDYNKFASLVWHRGGVEVTAYAIVIPDPAAGDSFQSLHETIEEMCILLSLARGTRIHYLLCEGITKSGEVAFSLNVHNPQLTRFSGRALNALQEGRALKAFVEATQPRLAEAEQKWNIRAAIELLTNAKAEGDPLALRGLKLANCIEFLRQKYLQINIKADLLPPELFAEKNRQKKFRKELRVLLREHFPLEEAGLKEEDYKEAIVRMSEHAPALNHYPFKRALLEMCNVAGLEIEPGEVAKLVDIRDILVHQAIFHASHGSEYEQYVLLESFVSRLLVAALGHPVIPPPAQEIEELQEIH